MTLPITHPTRFSVPSRPDRPSAGLAQGEGVKRHWLDGLMAAMGAFLGSASRSQTSGQVWGSACSLSWHADGDRVAYSESFKAMLGYAGDRAVLPAHFFDLVHPADRAGLERVFRSELHAAATNLPMSNRPVQTRLVAADGNWRWVRADIVSLDVVQGRVVHAVCAFCDITPEVVAQEALAASRRTLHAQTAELASLRTQLRAAQSRGRELERLFPLAWQSPARDLQTALARLSRQRSGPPPIEVAAARAHLEEAGARLDWVAMYSRLEQERLEPLRTPFELADLAVSVSRALAPLAEVRGVEIEVGPMNGTPTVLGDRSLSARAMDALCREAVLAAPKGSRVGLFPVVVAGRAGLELRHAHALRSAQRTHFFERPELAEDLPPLGPYAARLIARAQRGDLTLETAANGAASLRWMLPVAGEAPLSAPAPLH